MAKSPKARRKALPSTLRFSRDSSSTSWGSKAITVRIRRKDIREFQLNSRQDFVASITGQFLQFGERGVGRAGAELLLLFRIVDELVEPAGKKHRRDLLHAGIDC